MIGEERANIIEEELIIVRHSGEIPEIALHGSLHYLTRDEDGPGLHLLEEEKQALYNAAEKRCREIVLRDLNPDNRDLSLYRGVARTIANWHRYQAFCRRVGRDCSGFRKVAGSKLADFLLCEYREVVEGSRRSSINCSREQLLDFLAVLGVDCSRLPTDWQTILCSCTK